MLIAIDFSLHDDLNMAYGFYRYGVELINGLGKLDTSFRFLVIGSQNQPAPEIAHLFSGDSSKWTYTCFPRKKRRLGHFIDQWQFARMLARHQPEIVHALGNFVPFLTSCPVVATFHDLYEETLKGKGGGGGAYVRFLKMFGKYKLSKFIASSRQTASDLSHYWKINPNAINVIHLGTSFERIQVATEKREQNVIIARYNLFPGKNMNNLLCALANVVQQGYRPKLVLFGRADVAADREKEFDNLSEKLGIQGCIQKTGYLSDSELLRLYDTATVLVVPSLTEGFGLPLVEAMSRGLPVVANQDGATAEVVGDAGILVDVKDPVDLANGILKLLANPSVRQHYEALGYQRSNDFTSAKMALETSALYARIINKSRYLLFHSKGKNKRSRKVYLSGFGVAL